MYIVEMQLHGSNNYESGQLWYFVHLSAEVFSVH